MADEEHTEALTEARRLKRQVEEFEKNPIWLLLKTKLEIEISDGRRQYETPQGRSIDELVKNEANRGAIAAVSSILQFPQMMLRGAENTIQTLAQTEQEDDENDETS